MKICNKSKVVGVLLFLVVTMLLFSRWNAFWWSGETDSSAYSEDTNKSNILRREIQSRAPSPQKPSSLDNKVGILVLDNSDNARRVSIFKDIVKRVEKDGCLAALQYFQTLSQGEERQMGMAEALGVLSRESGIEEALKVIESLGYERNSDSLVAGLFVPRGPEDLSRVVKALGFLKNSGLRDDVINEIIFATHDYSSSEILEVLNGQNYTNEEQKVVEFCYSLSLAKTDPELVSERINAFDESQKGIIVAEVMKNWPSEDLNGGCSWLLENCHDQRVLKQGIWNLMEANVNRAPNEVMDAISSAPQSRVVSEAYGQLVEMVFDADSQLTKDWVAELPEGPGRRSAENAILRELFKQDPSGAMDFVETSSASLEGFNRQMSFVGSLWARSDPEGAVDWATAAASSYLSGEEHIAFRESVFETWAMTDPEGLISHGESYPEVTSDPKIVDLIYQSYSNTSMEGAADWLVRNNLDTNERLVSLVRNWIDSNPRDASEWVMGMEDVQGKSAIMSELVEKMRGSDATLGEDWAANINR